jgi:hypothetical protein
MAQGARSVRIGEAHAIPREPIDMGRGNLRVLIEATGITKAHIIHKNDDDVGLSVVLAPGNGRSKAGYEER